MNASAESKWATQYAWRKKRLEQGLCGYCGKPRATFKFLCDECAAKHRERQRRAVRVKCFWCAGGGEFFHQGGWVPCHVCAGEGKITRGQAEEMGKEMGAT